MSTVPQRRPLNRTFWLIIAGLVTVLIAVGAYKAISELLAPSPEAIAEPLRIQRQWRDVRESLGHEQHLQQKDISCWSCHVPRASGGVNIPDSSVCAACHEKQPTTLHAQTLSGPGKGDCLDCHGFDDDDTRPSRRCIKCHETAQGDAKAIHGHGDGKAECTSCHQAHKEPTFKPTECTQCHEKQIKLVHGTRKVAGAETCLACHGVHDTKKEPSQRCATCHATTKPRVQRTALFTGHDRCADCHEPHNFTKADAASCQSCHDDQKQLGGRKVAKHQRCKTCHTPHNVRAATEVSCRSCHRKVRNRHPKSKQGDRCLGCHPAHPKQRGRMLTASVTKCSSCHNEAKSETGFHAPGKTKCADCHKPHGFKATMGACTQCHEKQVVQGNATKRRGHAKCLTCHGKANHDAKAPTKPCASCHAKQRDAAPAKHRQCADCHRTHDGRVLKDCASCHAPQATTAPKGHDKCSTCHRAHRTTVLAKAQRCENCHGKQARTPHAKVKGGCQSCHRVHGPKGIAKAPTCASCHKSSELEGLHKVKEHNKCADCHRTHLPPLTSRASCMAGNCHTKQKDHEPKGRSCAACHPFKK